MRLRTAHEGAHRGMHIGLHVYLMYGIKTLLMKTEGDIKKNLYCQLLTSNIIYDMYRANIKAKLHVPPLPCPLLQPCSAYICEGHLKETCILPSSDLPNYHQKQVLKYL